MPYIIASNITHNTDEDDPMYAYGSTWEIFYEQEDAETYAKEFHDDKEEFYLINFADAEVRKKTVQKLATIVNVEDKEVEVQE